MNAAAVSRALVAVAALTIGFTGVVRAESSHHVTGDCTDFQILVPVSELTLGDSMPAEFVVVGTGTHTIAGLDALVCTNIVSDGQPAPSFVSSSLGLAVVPPGTSDHLTDGYMVWRLWSTTDVADGFAAAGVTCGDRATMSCLVPGLTFATQEGGGVTTVEQTVPWDRSRFDVRGTFGTPPQPGQSSIDVLWHRGVRGYLREKVPVTGYLSAAGMGEISAEAGSLLASLMGTGTYAGPAQLERYHFDAVTTVCATPTTCLTP
jgi:hypothetical protein